MIIHYFSDPSCWTNVGNNISTKYDCISNPLAGCEKSWLGWQRAISTIYIFCNPVSLSKWRLWYLPPTNTGAMIINSYFKIRYINDFPFPFRFSSSLVKISAITLLRIDQIHVSHDMLDKFNLKYSLIQILALGDHRSKDVHLQRAIIPIRCYVLITTALRQHAFKLIKRLPGRVVVHKE